MIISKFFSLCHPFISVEITHRRECIFPDAAPDSRPGVCEIPDIMSTTKQKHQVIEI